MDENNYWYPEMTEGGQRKQTKNNNNNKTKTQKDDLKF